MADFTRDLPQPLSSIQSRWKHQQAQKIGFFEFVALYRFLKSKDYSVAISPVDMFRHDLSMAVYKYEKGCGHHSCQLSAVLQVSYDTTTISFELMNEPSNWELVVTLTMDLREAGYIPALPINSVAYELEI